MPSNAAYSTEPSRGEFPQPNSSWFNGNIIGGLNTRPCPLNLATGYEISNINSSYDQASLYPIDTVTDYYVVLNLRHPTDPTGYQVWSVQSNGDAYQVDQSEPWNNPQHNFMRQLYDFDVATYCGERAPHNPPEPNNPCASRTQRALNMFKP